MSAPSPLTYNGYVSAIAALAVYDTQTVGNVVQGVDSAFQGIIPQMLGYAEQRIQRDLDLLPSLTSNSYTLGVGTNLLSVPVNDFVTLQTLLVTVNGQQIPLLPVTKEFIQNVCPATATPGPPQYFAMVGGDNQGGNTSNNVLIGPPANNSYPVSITGTVRLPSLNSFNTAPQASQNTTFISAWLPDLLLMASMIFVSGYQRNFSASGDDPQMPSNYEQQYAGLLKGAVVEEARKRFAAGAWASMGPTPIAAPSR